MNELHCDTFHRHIYSSSFSYYCDKISNYNDLKTIVLILTPSLRVQSKVVEEMWKHEFEAVGHVVSVLRRQRDKDDCVQHPPPSLYLSFSLWSYTIYGTAHIEGRVGVPLFNFWNHPHRHI